MSELQNEVRESPKEMHLPYLESKSEGVVPQPISGDVCDNKNDCFVNIEKSHLGISGNDNLQSRLETHVPDTAFVEYLCSGDNPEPTKCRVMAQSVEESDNKEEEFLKDDRLLKENKNTVKIVDGEINDNSQNSVCILEDTKDTQVVNGDPEESIALDTSQGIEKSKCSELLSNESKEVFESTSDNGEELASVSFNGVNQEECLEGSEENPVSASNSEYNTLNIHGNETREDNQTSHTNSESSLGGIIRSVCGRRPVRKACFKAQNRPFNVEEPVKNEVDDLGTLEANMLSSLKRKSFDSDTVILKKPKIDDSMPLFSVVSSHFHILRNKLSDRIIEKKQVYSEDTICDKGITNLKGIAENPTTKDNSNYNVHYKMNYQNSWCSVM